jgi:hypothetical protein
MGKAADVDKLDTDRTDTAQPAAAGMVKPDTVHLDAAGTVLLRAARAVDTVRAMPAMVAPATVGPGLATSQDAVLRATLHLRAVLLPASRRAVAV